MIATVERMRSSTVCDVRMKRTPVVMIADHVRNSVRTARQKTAKRVSFEILISTTLVLDGSRLLRRCAHLILIVAARNIDGTLLSISVINTPTAESWRSEGMAHSACLVQMLRTSGRYWNSRNEKMAWTRMEARSMGPHFARAFHMLSLSATWMKAPYAFSACCSHSFSSASHASSRACWARIWSSVSTWAGLLNTSDTVPSDSRRPCEALFLFGAR
mmetsp:Transcript_35473/g.70987  ORF Transcript_35473/g.70987 Transcript_35473/m.70987 type:complete len:217 (+) Transcript_35473:1545-2195(+)